MCLSQAKFILIASAKPIQPFPRKTRERRKERRNVVLPTLKRGKKRNLPASWLGAVVPSRSGAGSMVTRLGDICVLFSADLSLIPDAPFSQVFNLTSISISQPLVQCWCPRCSHGCVSRVCLRSPSFAQGNFSSVSQRTGNEGSGVQRGKKPPGWEGDAGCLAKHVGAGLGGQRDGVRLITATSLLGNPMVSFVVWAPGWPHVAHLAAPWPLACCFQHTLFRFNPVLQKNLLAATSGWAPRTERAVFTLVCLHKYCCLARV